MSRVLEDVLVEAELDENRALYDYLKKHSGREVDVRTFGGSSYVGILQPLDKTYLVELHGEKTTSGEKVVSVIRFSQVASVSARTR